MNSTRISKVMGEMTTPLVPRKSDKDREEELEFYMRKIRMTIDSLSFHWGMGLPDPSNRESPANLPRTIDYEIVSKIKFLCYKAEIDPLIRQFEVEAHGMYTGWVLKPTADRGVRGVPEKTRQCQRPVSDEERKLLLKCLLKILTVKFDAIKTPSKPRLEHKDPNAPLGQPIIDSSPIPFNLSRSKTDSKRTGEPIADQDGAIKKPKFPRQFPDVRSASTSFNSSMSAQTSFVSNAPSAVFSNPELNDSEKGLSVFTQDTVPTQAFAPLDAACDTQAYRDTHNISFQSNTQSSQYEGASSFDADVVKQLDSQLIGVGQSDPIIDEEFSQNMVDQAAFIDGELSGLDEVDELILGEETLRQGLNGVFRKSCPLSTSFPPSTDRRTAKTPLSLRDLPFRVSYEIARVFLHAEVPLEDVEIPPLSDQIIYNKLWQYLKNHPLLHGKAFPQKSSQEAWDIAGEDGFQRRTRAVYIRASIRFNSQQPVPFFRLHLDPLMVDKSNRTGRRFGHDRVFEVDMPSLSGRHVPEMLRRMGPPGRDIIVGWLVDESHQFLGKSWKPFHLKALKKEDQKFPESTDDPVLAHRVFFFAIDGVGFVGGAFPVDPLTKPHIRISVDALLNSIRPTRKNLGQSYLKLFARTSLGNFTLLVLFAVYSDTSFSTLKECCYSGA